MNLDECFDRFQESAFRVEGLPSYSVEAEQSAISHFESTGKVPEGFNGDWSGFVRESLEAGKTVQRLRLQSDVPTSYEKFELIAYGPGVRAGEEIRVALRADHPYEEDFWLFDNQWWAVMHYSVDGYFIDADVSEIGDKARQIINYWLRIFTDSPLLGE